MDCPGDLIRGRQRKTGQLRHVGARESRLLDPFSLGRVKALGAGYESVFRQGGGLLLARLFSAEASALIDKLRAGPKQRPRSLAGAEDVPRQATNGSSLSAKKNPARTWTPSAATPSPR